MPEETGAMMKGVAPAVAQMVLEVTSPKAVRQTWNSKGDVARSRSPRHKLEAAADADVLDGSSAEDLFESKDNRTGYTYDDLILLPGYIGFGVHEVSLESNFTRRIKLRMPIASSPMDTVTEAKTAIAMALEGGVGVIHSNLSVEDQVK
jgi:hypothetical protein